VLTVCRGTLESSRYIKMATGPEAPSGFDKDKFIGTVDLEMEVGHKVELFNTLTQTCYAKCIPRRYKEGELNIGECSCVDRCVAKYSQVTAIIGRVLSSGRPHI